MGWEHICSNFKEGDTIEGTIIRKIKGGFMVNIGLDAFLPASLAVPREFGGPDGLLSKKLQFVIVKIVAPREPNDEVLSLYEQIAEKSSDSPRDGLW